MKKGTIPAFPNVFPFNELLLSGKLSAKTRVWKWNHAGWTLLYTSTRCANETAEAYELNKKDFPQGEIVGIGKLLPVREITEEERERIEKEFGNGKNVGIFAGPYVYEFENLTRFKEPVPFKWPQGAVRSANVPLKIVEDAIKKAGINISK